MIALFLAQATAHGPNCGVAGAGAGAAAASGTHRLCVFRTSELSLEEGSSLGVGSFGSVQVGQWRGTDVAIKASNCVGGLDSTSLDREREMCVGSAAFAYALGIGDVHALGVLPLWELTACVPTPSPTMHPPPPLLFYVATACALLYLGQGQPYYGLNEWLGWVHFVHPAVLA